MTLPSPLRRALLLFALLLGILCFGLGTFFIMDHARIVLRAEEALPDVERLTVLRHRVAVLKAQLEVADLEESVRGTAHLEQLRTNVLPREIRLEGLVGALELLRDQLIADRQLETMSDVQLGAVTNLPSSGMLLQAYPLTVSFVGTKQALSTIGLFVELSGAVTVGDILSQGAIERLLTATEEENPAAVTAVEQFLSLSLLSYARSPERFDDLLAKSFLSPEFLRRLHVILSESKLSSARYLLGGAFGESIERQNLWPLRFLSLEKSTVETLGTGRHRLELRLIAYVRPS